MGASATGSPELLRNFFIIAQEDAAITKWLKEVHIAMKSTKKAPHIPEKSPLRGAPKSAPDNSQSPPPPIPEKSPLRARRTM
jgi:hypothetical protein